MKPKYECECCGKVFSTAKEAIECEKSHEVEKRKNDLCKKSEEAINKLFNQHIREFGVLPTINLESDNREVFSKLLCGELDTLCDEVIKRLDL